MADVVEIAGSGRRGVMPVGSPMVPIRPQEVETFEGDERAPVYTDEAVATLVWDNYNEARQYVENNAWLLEWQETDILYQSPTPDRFTKVQNYRPARVSRFLVAKFTRTLARALKRALFAEQIPFLLRPLGDETQEQMDAWTALIAALLKRMNFKYHGGLLINTQTLQGTGIGKPIWEERKVIKKTRKRVHPPATATMPTGEVVETPTEESDTFEIEETEVVESWPAFEYRRLGTTLFDPKWCTPDAPRESAGYVIDVNYVTFGDLSRMRELDCYQNIPDEETLKAFFFHRMNGAAPMGSQLEDSFTAQGSQVTHAEARNRQTDRDPLKQPLMMLEQWDERTVKAIIVYDGQKLTIRNEEHGLSGIPHVTATWWPIDNCGYGMGIGRINSGDQRINQGVLNESLKMIAYPMNAPILTARGDNAPTQNTINRHGGYQPVDVPAGGDVRKAMAFMEMPEPPQAAWKMLELSQQGGEEVSGANSQAQQGNLGGPGSSFGRTATGASRIAGMSDQNVADPVDSFADGVIVPVVNFLIECVKEKMPLAEIRQILSKKHAAVIEKAIDEEQFLDCEFEVTVLAGQKLAAKQGIQQLIPLFLQIVQQPQLLEYLHQKGQTINFTAMMDLMLQVSELQEQPDIFVPLTDEEKQHMQQMNPGAQKVQGAVAVETVRGKNKQQEIQTKGEVDLANKAAEIAMQHTADGIPLTRAEGLLERSDDENVLRNGLPDQMMQ
jgi:hypothetical protein